MFIIIIIITVPYECSYYVFLSEEDNFLYIGNNESYQITITKLYLLLTIVTIAYLISSSLTM